MTEDLQTKMEQVARAFRQGRYRYTCTRRSNASLEHAVATGEIIEDYPAHRYGPACLILGQTADGRPLPVICSLRPIVDLVTVYEPDTKDWESDWRTRRR